MWGESSQNCENNCQCSGLITDAFRINSGNSATKRKQAEAVSTNFKNKMHPHSLDFKTPLSPLLSPRATPSKRRVLGEINSNMEHSPFRSENSFNSSSVFKSNTFTQPRRILGETQNIEPPFKCNKSLKTSELYFEDTQSPFKYSPFKGVETSIELGGVQNLENKLGESNSFFGSSTFRKSYTTQRISSETSVSLSTLLRPKASPVIERLKAEGPAIDRSTTSPVSSKREKRTTKISRIFEERSRFKMTSSNKENVESSSNTFMQETSIDFQKTSLNFQKNSLDFQETSFDFQGTSLKTSLDFQETSLKTSLDFQGTSLKTSLDFQETSLKTSLDFQETSLDFQETSYSFQETSLDFNESDRSGDLNKTAFEVTCFGEDIDGHQSSIDFQEAVGLNNSNYAAALHKGSPTKTTKLRPAQDFCVPEKDDFEDTDFETLHDLEEEFENDNFDSCMKYEIISTDSPNIISRGRTSSSRKIAAKNFVFGAPIGKDEASTSFNTKPTVSATRMLNFEDENYEFASPASNSKRKTSFSVKKSLKFTETPFRSIENSPSGLKTPSKSINIDRTPSKSIKIEITPTKADNILLGATPTKSLKIGSTPTKAFLHPLRHERSDSSIGSMVSSPSSSQGSHLRLFTSESTTSMESGFVSELEEPFLDLEDTSNSPKMANFSELLSGPIKDDIFSTKSSLMKRPLMQRCLSFNPETKAKHSLFTEDTKRSQKRQEPLPVEVANKKRKSENEASDKPMRPTLQRAFSENHASIMSALTRSCTEPDLIADFSAPYALPLADSPHSDLKAITCDTLAQLLRLQYTHTIAQYSVIDCRYPYEYEGGHIDGATNLHTPAHMRALLDAHTDARAHTDRRTVLVLHCEFSLERGPKLYRYLRSADRSKNAENYPHLHYPEVYLLHEGYRSFFQRYPELCTPAGYTPMLDPNHTHLLRKHRSTEEPASFFTHHRTKGTGKGRLNML